MGSHSWAGRGTQGLGPVCTHFCSKRQTSSIWYRYNKAAASTVQSQISETSSPLLVPLTGSTRATRIVVH